MCFVFGSATFGQDQVSSSISWSASEYYLGEYGQANVTLFSNCSQALEINFVGIHFDWNNNNTYFYYTLNSSITLPSYGNHTFNSIIFYVPPEIALGPHTFFVHFEGTENGQSSQSIEWNSKILTMQVYSKDEVTYDQLQPQVSSQIAEAEKANYKSSEAKSLLQNATQEFNQATSSANQMQWQSAVTHLQNASNALDGASSKEQAYLSQQTLLTEAIIAVVVIGAVLTLIAVVRTKLKTRKDNKEKVME